MESGEWCVGLVVAFSAFCSVATLGCTLNNCRDGTVFAPIAIAEVDPGILTGRAPEPVGDVTPVVTEGYPPFMPLYYSLDTVMPFIPFGIENQWAPNADFQTWFEMPIKLGSWEFTWRFGTGRLLILLALIEELLGAVLVAVAVTGFTGILTRDDR